MDIELQHIKWHEEITKLQARKQELINHKASVEQQIAATDRAIESLLFLGNPYENACAILWSALIPASFLANSILEMVSRVKPALTASSTCIHPRLRRRTRIRLPSGTQMSVAIHSACLYPIVRVRTMVHTENPLKAMAGKSVAAIG
jgi:hypothetical protein